MSSRSALRNRRKRSPKTFHATERRLSHQTLERRELLAGELGPQLISISANSGENFRLAQQNILRESPTQLTFRFDGSQQLDASTLAAISIQRSGGDGSFTEGNEIRIDPGFLGFGDSSRIVVARFAETLPDDTYRIRIAGYDDTNQGIVGLRNSDGELLRVAGVSDPLRPQQQIQFRVELGPQVVAIVPQPITGVGASRAQQRNQIHVYFNEDPLSNPAAGPITTGSSAAAVVQTRYYSLFFTDDKVENTEHDKFNPTSVTYSPALNRAVLTFAGDISNLAPGGSGAFRLRVGSAQDLPAAPAVVDNDLTTDVGGTFSGARNLGVSFNANPQSILIGGEIEASLSYPIQWPGIDTPGTRDNRRDPQVIGQPDSTPGINVYFYNFADAYGLDPFGNVLDNAITSVQQQRTREILALYSQHLGVQFIETENRGLQIVTGDLRALVRPAITGPGEPLHEYRLNDQDPTQGVLVLDSGENWYDGYGLSPDIRPSWFVEALRGIGSLLGIGHTFDQVPGVASGSNPALYNAAMFPLPGGTIPSSFSIEPDFLSTSDIIPGQALHRPEIRDVDLYSFNVAADGRISIETFAQRLDDTSTLDTEITLWKLNPANNQFEIVARNNDFYSDDSFIGVEVSPNADGSPARYYVSVTALGNQDYNPSILDSGLGGLTQGRYEMRITFQNTNVDTIRDVNGTPLDGNSNGVPGGDFNFWFRTAKIKGTEASGESRTLFVDKSGVNNTSAGTLASPYRTIAYAFSQSRAGDIVRILPSAGTDGRIDTVADNQAYEIGRGGPSNAILPDGETFNVPRGVTVMIDAGTIIKLRNAKISVGSSRVDDDRSLAALQVLGTPVLVNNVGSLVDGRVVFTSYQDESFGVDTNPLPTTPAPGQWAGIEFRNDFDYSEGRPVWETEGIFLDYVAHADIRYGGGSISATEPIVNPLQMLDARPTIIYNTIRFSSDAAISADPNSFAETNFHAPVFQRVASFTSDYDRVGPDIRGNRLVDNSINGLFVRVRTPAAGAREPMTVSGRFDDFDITHAISEVLVLQGQPGGPKLLQSRPDVLGVSLINAPNPAPPTGTLTTGQVLNYRVTFVTRDGVESLASLPTNSVTVGGNRNIRLTNLPQATEDFSGRRLYRLNPSTGNYVFVTQLDRNTTAYTDTGKTRGGLLSGAAIAAVTSERLFPRFDARLSIDPGLVIKLDSARIEAGVGADFYAEGIDGKPIVFTSRLDDEFGAGGTFDTNNDRNIGLPQPGAWAGLVFRQGSTASLDHTHIRFAGGGSSVSGGFATFNPVEILQADVRIANSVFSENAAGYGGNLDFRDGIGFNGEATIFVRGAQPTIVNNIIRDNLGAAISINPDSLNYLEIQDTGRATGNIDLIQGRLNNQGALIVGNRLDGNGINGMMIRQEALTTESVWDDTDIVHVLEGQVYAWNHHQRSGLRLKSAPDESLVVKSFENGGITAARYLNDVEDSIGGTLQVIGTPGFPVVLTSIRDCTVGAGFTPEGLPQNDTLESGACRASVAGPEVIDVVLALDDTFSFQQTGSSLIAEFPRIVADLQAALPNASFAFSIVRFEEYQVQTTGVNSTIRPFILNQPMLETVAANFQLAIDAALARINPANGTDFTPGSDESYIEALYQIATGIGFDGDGNGNTIGSGPAGLVSTQIAAGATGDVPAFSSFVSDLTGDPNGPVLPASGTVGGVGFRANATRRIVLLGTDGSLGVQNDGLTTYTGLGRVTVPVADFNIRPIGFFSPGGRGAGIQETVNELVNQNIQVIGLGGSPTSRSPLRTLATLTGALDSNGNPLYFDIVAGNGSIIAAAIVDAITISASVGNSAAAGDWQGIRIAPGANDRNVAFVLETEPAIPEAAGLNAIPSTAQVIGSLATSEYSADENRRLGFNIRGTLGSNNDNDVYSFFANGQTEVYLDIDDTSFGLDTLVELIDINGNILALSNSSDAESTNRNLLVNNIGTGAVLPLFKTGQRLVEGPNSLDPGMRVVLPGNSNSVNQYFVRVRSSNLAPGDPRSKLVNTNAIGQGLSQGQYQLSVRLRESDEIAGSTVRLADIRFATHAIDVSSSPFDSPLAAEFAERLQVNGLDVDGAGNFTNAGAQNLGSLNSSHRNVLRVSGFLGNNVANPALFTAGQDIDVYRVDLFDERLVPEIIGENRFVTAVFDIDYADQLARANTRLSIFDSAGRLIMHGLNSNVADDQGRPRLGNDMANLAGGSAGTLDSYIGPIELQEGTYYVVVSSAQMTPQALDQFFNSGATDTNVRMLPLDSVRRVAEDGFDDSVIGVNQYFPLVNTQQRNTTAELPTVVPLFDETSIVPYTLEDVRLFVTLQGGLSGGNQTTVISVDPFTGQLERTIGQFGQPVGDVAIRRDGELFAYSLGPAGGGRNTGNTGQYLNVSPINGASSDAGDDGLTFNRNNEAGDNTEADPNGYFLINAMAFVPQGPTSGASIVNVPGIPDGERLFVVGDRLSSGRFGEVPIEYRENIVYSMVAINGAATNRGSTNPDFDRNFGAITTPYFEPYGPASNKQEFGVVDVGQFIDSDPTKTGGSITGIALNQNLPGFFSQTLFGVTDEGGLYSFNTFDSRTLDLSPTIIGTYNRIINSEFHGTVQRHSEHFGFGAPEFASLTLGPRATEFGRYDNVFFATTTDGWIYTFQIDINGVVEPAPVLVHGRSAVQIISALGGPATIGRQVTGVAFSIREENPWHQTSDRNLPFAAVTAPNDQTNLHGVFQPHNQTRIRSSGATSLYFGFEPSGDQNENTINNDGATGNLAPGGAHGTTVSRPFSLEDYGAADEPTLYFNYFLEVQGDNDATLARRQLDSFRVFATGDDGQWQLLATNNSFRSFLNPDEYDYFAETGIPVQELHDNTNVWRQARIDLSPLAGNKNVQLRFDFSTGGGMQNQFRATGYLTEIQAVPGRELVDGSGFSLREEEVGSNNLLTNFQFVRGASINLPAGNAIFNGQVISVVGSAGAINLTLTLDPPTGPDEIQFARTDTAAAIASRVVTALQLLDPTLETVAVGATVRIPEALSFQLTPERFAAMEIEIPTDVSSLLSQPLVLTDLLGNDTTIRLETVQDVSFTVGGQTVTVTANFLGFFDGYLIRFVNNPLLGDVAPTAVTNFGQRSITVTYNSLAATPTNRDFNAVVAALDGQPFFSATLTAGVGTVPFTPPTLTPQFPTGETYYSLTNTPEQVAVLVANAINNSPRITATVSGRQIVILGAAARALSGGYIETSFNQGSTNSQLLANGAYPIFYHREMSALEVRDAVRAALANGLGVQNPATGISQATIDSYPGYATNRIRVFEQLVIANTSAIGFSTFLPGDEFGSFGSTNISTSATTGALTRNAGTNNTIEGVYVDDIVIGFAGRGEMVLNAPADQRNFVIDPTYRSILTSDLHQPEFPDEVLVGGYTLEVRNGPAYGVPHDYDPIRLGLNEQFSWGRSFDINDRLNPGAVTLLAPSGRELIDGQTFVISNGQRSLTFEFDNNGSVAQGNVRVPFTPLISGSSFNNLTNEPAEVARSIRDAINSPQARGVLGITAAGGDSSEVGPMTGNRIELFGDVIHINPSSGRFLTVDMVAESTPYGRESFRALPQVNHANETVDNFFMLDPYTRARTTQYLNNATQFVIDSVSDTPNLAGATVTQYRDGQADTLVAKGKIGDTVVTGLGNERIPSNPLFDADVVKIFLNAGDTIDALVETNRFNRGAPFRTPRVQVFADDANNTELADSLTFDPFDFADPNNPFGIVNPVPFNELAIEARIESFLAPTSGFYFVTVSSIGRLFGSVDPSELIGQYQLTVRPSGLVASEPVAVEYHLEGGDVNVFRPQGQLIIESNFISDFDQTGVSATYAGPQIPGIANVSPLQLRPGGAALLRNQNTDRLLPGTVIMNNVITATQGTGILFAGETPVGGQAPAPVPFGRIINNTVVYPAQADTANPINVVFLPIDAATIMGPNDDGSSAIQTFGFDFRFFGSTYTQFYVNNNGNLTFANPLGAFTAGGFPQTRPIIAPFWADVDTRQRAGGAPGGTVHLTRGVSPTSGNPVVQMDWVNVGYFPTSSPANTGATNTFTVYIESNPQGDIVAFRYGGMAWTTGGASGGTNGFGGTGAQIGFDSGDGTNFISLGRPRSQAELDALFVDAPFVFQINPTTGIPGGSVSTGSGILVENSASPTILNNVISGFDIGLNVSANSNSTVENGNAFQRNTRSSNRPLASQSVEIPADIPLFEDITRRLFIPAAGSRVIDSSFANLNDRATFFNTVKQPVGISASPILAPTFDAYGIPRVDDPTVTTPGGIGGNVFIDRGGIDRSDSVQPTVVLISPIDFILGQGVQVAGGDNDPDASFVRLPAGSGPVTFFEIQLLDPAGTGPDASTINQNTVILTENGVTLVPGVDYTFGYSDNRRLIRLTPLAGLWRPDAVYEITLNNRDRVSLTLPRGEVITDGEQYVITDGQGRQSVFEFDSGFVMQVPQTLAIEVLGPNTFFNDGDVFTVVSPSGAVRRFEINLSGAVASGNISINLASAGTVIEIRDVILTALAGAQQALNLAPVALTNDSLQIGSLFGHTMTGTVAGLRFFGVGDGVSVGDEFRYQAGANSVLFRFTDGIMPVGPSAVAIIIARTDTVDQIADKIGDAVAAQSLGLSGARAIGDGRVVLGGTPADQLDASNSELDVIGIAGVTGRLQMGVSALATAATLEGQTFTIQNGSVSVNFVLTTNPALVTPNRRVVLALTATPAQIASAIAAEIVAGFSGALPATTNGRFVMLNEQASIIPAGTTQILASVISSTLLLNLTGVSGGAIAVPFIPTRLFSPASAAAALTTAVATSPLQVTTFTPGGGTVLFDNTAMIDRVVPGGIRTPAGISLPAVTDLAGNPIESNRNNDETRFTITMPEVRFDFGDAPASYGTLLANNGARHSVGANATPRLGRVVDTETDGQPFTSDDVIMSVVATSPGGSSLFSFATLPPVGTAITISSTVTPTSGDRIRVTIGSDSATFELVAPGVASLTGNIPIALVPTDTPMSIAAKLAAAITGELAPTGRAVAVAVDPVNPVIRIETLDDEDGVAVGQITVGFQSYFVFLDPAADQTAATPNDVLGFLNPLDPSGTSVAVTVTGAGLLDAWVDFDGDGSFDPSREQVLQNRAVVDGVNILNITTPTTAVAGTTWIRFRLSTTGNLRPTGSAVGGEVEDYRVSIIPVAPFQPVNDSYTTIEDVPLVVTPISPQLPLLDNDLNLSSPFLPPRAVVVAQPANGTVTITDPLTGSFDYVPNPAFNGIDTFTYRLSSEGDARAAAPNAIIATVTITVTAVNDAPVADVLSPIELLEQDDALPVTVPGVITNALPGRPEAIDEIASQTIAITIDSAASNIPVGLFQSAPVILPILNSAGVLVGADLRFVQNPDAFGTALIVINVRDNHSTNPRTTAIPVTLNIRPVNDAPRLNPALLGVTDNQGPDNVYLVANGSDPATAAGTIVYTSAEDQLLFIPVRRPTGVIGFNRVGLLDVFTVGPNNETLAVAGGNQILDLLGIPARTSAGGTLTPVIVAGQVTGFNYQPPRDFNSVFGGLDSFTYSVGDDNPLGGETWDRASGGLIDDRLVSQGFVQLRINPVNDRPQFQMSTNSVSVLEDSGQFRLTGFAFNTFAGPPATAFDEIDPASGQSVTFSVSGLTPATSQLFAVAPTVSPAGVLTFTPAANAFGTAVLEVRATDNGPDNAIRGDEVSSLAQTFTINLRPVNDRPELNTTTPISYTLNEDSAILQSNNIVTFQGIFIPLNGAGGQVGLLDVFNPGPANESSNITPGGNQTLSLATPVPASTAQGGTLTRIFDPLNPSVLIGLRYTPRANFNGADSFIYGVRDNGVSTDLSGIAFPDPKESFNTVTLNVLALNDRPQFSGPLSVTVDEDATTTSTIGRSSIPNFVTDIAAGPPGAVDELDPVTGQRVSFVITPVTGNPANLFIAPPVVSATGTLTFQTVPDANGVAVFTIFAEDNGPNNPPLEFNTSTPPRTFTITVNPVNDAPSFVPVLTAIEVPEDSGPFTTSEPFATQILPGPPDEVAAGQTVRFEVTVPTAGRSLFQAQPTVTDNGFFRFTPRDNAVGSTIVSVVAIDSEGARSTPASVTLTLLEVNDVPVAGNVSFSGDENTVFNVPLQSLLAVAVDPDLQTNPNEVLRLTALSLTSQNGAIITVLPSGNIQYDPSQAPLIQALRAGQLLPDTFTYRLVDTAGALSNIATVTINLTGVNDAPTVRDDFVTLPLSGPATIRPLDNDFDIDGTINPSTLEISLLPAFGSVQVRSDGTIIYTPFENFRGSDTIRYTVADNLGARSEQATITIDMNLPPIAVNDISNTFRDRAVEINVAENDSDPDGQLDLESIRIVTQPTRGSAIVLGGGIVRYLPGSDFIGVDTFQYTINDQRGRPSNVGQVRIQVVASELQNPSNFFDVNSSGEVSPLDALLILNRLARAAREGMGGSIPVGQLINEVPRLFYDVDGNRSVEPLDALAVINEIARQNRRGSSGEGEQAAGIASLGGAGLAAPLVAPMGTGFGAATRVADFESVYGPVPGADDADTFAADFGLPDEDVIHALAVDTAKEEAEKRRSELLEAIDAAWTDAAQF